MQADLQLSVIREFMVAIAPTIVRDSLRRIVYDAEGQMPTNTAAQAAQLALEYSMHLAGRYAAAYDSLVDEAKPTKDPIKKESKTNPPLSAAKG